MKHISILVPKGAVALSCIEGSFIAFSKANDFMKSLGKEPIFQVQLVGLSKEAQVYDRFFSVAPDKTIKDSFRSDLIIIPAVNGDRDEVISMNKDFFPWIVKNYEK